ncbi:hypothetical protein HOY80DRAFT_1001187 [Tuber brumale]|nr:hypothetical protein HOY80DRAFT_1001187 [Tuber brumale]
MTNNKTTLVIPPYYQYSTRLDSISEMEEAAAPCAPECKEQQEGEGQSSRLITENTDKVSSDSAEQVTSSCASQESCDDSESESEEREEREYKSEQVFKRKYCAVAGTHLRACWASGSKWSKRRKKEEPQQLKKETAQCYDIHALWDQAQMVRICQAQDYDDPENEGESEFFGSRDCIPLLKEDPYSNFGSHISLKPQKENQRDLWRLWVENEGLLLAVREYIMKTGETKVVANYLKPSCQDSVVQSYSNINMGYPDNEEVAELVLEALEKVAIQDGQEESHH